MARRNAKIIDYTDIDEEKVKSLFRGIPQEAFWGAHEIEPDMFDLQKYVDYFSRSWAPDFYPELMLAAQSEEDGEYLALMHIAMEGRRAAIACLCTHLTGREGQDLLATLIHTGEKASLALEAETLGIPMISGICLTFGVDSANLDSVLFFRKLGFKPAEVSYAMSLDLESYKPSRNLRAIRSRLGERQIEYRHEEREGEQIWEMLIGGEKVGKFEINGIRNEMTDVGIDVEKDQRGRGLGTLLFSEGLSRIREMGVKRAELAVDGDNIPAISLYNKAGFKVDRTMLVMDKQLQPNQR